VKTKQLLVFFMLMGIGLSCSSQQTTDTIKIIHHFSGSVNVTNNGISLVPNFSLGKPAVIINLSAGKSRFSFDPDIRFSLSAKPWTMLFWTRYKVVPTGKLRLSTGAHLGLNFKTTDLYINGDTAETNIVRRYLAAELVPNYFLTKNISTGLYYLYSHGLDAGTVNNTHFLVFNVNFSNIKISSQFFARFTPQLYYLKQDVRHGSYFTSQISIAKKNFPLSVSGLINQRLSGDIAGSKNFIWSGSLIYSFNRNYIPKPQAP
jgi:hypothetical protein